MTSEGAITYSINGKQVEPENVYREVSICAPYLDVMEEMTLVEFLRFHSQFRDLLLTTEGIIQKIGLGDAQHKQIRFYSSGMRQRVKLAQCIFSNSSILLLDEPCTNLDKAGIELYHSLVKEFGKDRLIVVSSNDEVEYSFCEERILISDYKKN